MPISENDIVAFPTVLGRDLLLEAPNFVAAPYLVVTMADLWPKLKHSLPKGTAVHFVESMERAGLEAKLAELDDFASIVRLGGGQAIDCAKYFAWRRRLPLHQFPTSLSVDAMYGQRAGVREKCSSRRCASWCESARAFEFARSQPDLSIPSPEVRAIASLEGRRAARH